MTPTKVTQAIALALLLGASSLAFSQVTVSVNLAPPELPVYDQPPIPADGYVWTPGYWAWSDDEQGYYWVPGTWIEAPQSGYLWTPGYWAFGEGVYLWNPGYWGPHVGFYGGVNYGYGYTGAGYQGGYWRDGHMFYNRSVVNVGESHITNVYNRTVINNVTVNRVSYNGGNGGLRARPTPADEQAAHDRHIEATGAQHAHIEAASRDSSLRVSENHGRPGIAATAEPGHFTGNHVSGARNAVNAPQNQSAPHEGGAPQNHNDLPRNTERDSPQRTAPRQPPQQSRPAPQAEPHPPQGHPPAPRQNAPEPRSQPPAQRPERAPEHEPDHH